MKTQLEEAILDFAKDIHDVDQVLLNKPTVLFNCGSVLTQLANQSDYSLINDCLDLRFNNMVKTYNMDPWNLGSMIKHYKFN